MSYEIEPEWPSGRQYCACCTDGHGFKPWPEPPPMLVNTSASMWIKKGSAAMLTSFQSAGITPEVNLRVTQMRKHAKRDPPWL